MCKVELHMEEEVEFVSRALSTASFLMAPMPPPEVKQKQVWDAASRKVVIITEEAPRRHDLTSVAHAQRFQALRQFFESGSKAKAEHSKPTTSQSGGSLSKRSVGDGHSSLADSVWPDYSDDSTKSTSRAVSGHHRSRRNSTLINSHADMQPAHYRGSESRRHSRKTAETATLVRKSAPLDRAASTAAADEATAYSSSTYARSNRASVEIPATPARASRATADLPGTRARSTRASIDMLNSRSGSGRPSIDIPSLHLSSSQAGLEFAEQCYWRASEDASTLYSAEHGKPRASSSKYGGSKQHSEAGAASAMVREGRVTSSRARRNSVAIMQNHASTQHQLDSLTASSASAEHRSAPGGKLRRSSVLVVSDHQSQVKSTASGAATRSSSPQTRSAHSSKSRRGSLVIPQEHQAVRFQASVSAAAVADAAGDAVHQVQGSVRRDARSQSLDALWQEAHAPSAAPARAARTGRSASDVPGAVPVTSNSLELLLKGRSSPSEQVHSATSLAAIGQHASSEGATKSAEPGAVKRASPVSGFSAGTHADRVVFAGSKLHDFEVKYQLQKAKSTPIPSTKHKASTHKLKRSKTGYLEEELESPYNSGRFYSSSGSKSAKKFGSGGVDSKSFKRYVPQISKIDERALQRVGESDCASYVSLLDKGISQSLQWM